MPPQASASAPQEFTELVDGFQMAPNGNSGEGAATQQQLRPADRGSAAWKLLGAAFVFEALLWGTRRSISGGAPISRGLIG